MPKVNQRRIVVADDSTTIQKVFELAFENEAIEVIIASNGDDALERVIRTRPSMVIADVNMPGLDGFQLCAALKNNMATSQIPVYLMSSALDEFDLTKSERVGAAGRFEKPFRSENMVSKVKDVIASLPVLQEPEDDSFEDIDVQLDSLLETAGGSKNFHSESGDNTEHMDMDEVGETDLEENDSTIDDISANTPEPSEDETPEILELKQSSIIEENDGDIDSEEDLELEIVSGQDDGNVIELGTDMDNMTEAEEQSPENQSTISGLGTSDLDEIATSAEDTTQVLDLEKELYDYLDSDAVANKTNAVPDSAKPEGVAMSEVEAGSQLWVEATNKAVEDVISTSYFQTLIEDEVKMLISEKLTGGNFEEAITKGVQNSMSELQPKILEEINKITREMTLSIAEDLVKKTIDQIKPDQSD